MVYKVTSNKTGTAGYDDLHLNLHSARLQGGTNSNERFSKPLLHAIITFKKLHYKAREEEL